MEQKIMEKVLKVKNTGSRWSVIVRNHHLGKDEAVETAYSSELSLSSLIKELKILNPNCLIQQVR